MFFIHTFSMIKVFKKREEVEQLWKIYNQKNITEKKVFRINEFSDKGVRLVIRDLEKQRKRFEKVTTEVEIIVTPYKPFNYRRRIYRGHSGIKKDIT